MNSAIIVFFVLNCFMVRADRDDDDDDYYYFGGLNQRELPKVIRDYLSMRPKRSYDYNMLVDNAYDERRDDWKKYTCRKVRVPPHCSNGKENTGSQNCFAPTEKTLRGFNEKDGWHKELTCKSSETHNVVLLYVNQNDHPISVGRGNTSKLIRCNNNNEWVTKDADNKWIVVNEVECITTDNSDIGLLDSIDQ